MQINTLCPISPWIDSDFYRNICICFIIIGTRRHLDPEAALRKMRKWIHRNPDLYRELYAGTEGKNEQAYSKRQVAIIVRYLEAP